MEQIKVKELPVGYFVTDKHYQSGNKEFVSKELCWFGDHSWTNNIPKEIFGTKHIQLIAANPSIFQREQLLPGVLTKENMDKMKNAISKNIDIFIYEVSEVNNVCK